MKTLLTMGFIRSEKKEERRIALLPKDLTYIQHKDQLFFEQGYGKDFAIEDDEYIAAGCHVVDKATLLEKDILCDTKIGEAHYLNSLSDGKVLFGWIHAGGDTSLTQLLQKHKHTCYAWEDMYEQHRHIFWKNNEIAGAGGVFHALQQTGWMPYGKKAAIIGRGDAALGALRMLSRLGVETIVYNREQELLFQEEAVDMDILVIAVRWDTKRSDYLVNDEVLKNLKKDAIIIDVSADPDGAICASKTTDILHPVYQLHHTMVYSVNNIPSVYYKSATIDISDNVSKYVDSLVEQRETTVLENCKIIQAGKILDQRIIDVQQLQE